MKMSLPGSRCHSNRSKDSAISSLGNESRAKGSSFLGDSVHSFLASSTTSESVTEDALPINFTAPNISFDLEKIDYSVICDKKNPWDESKSNPKRNAKDESVEFLREVIEVRDSDPGVVNKSCKPSSPIKKWKSSMSLKQMPVFDEEMKRVLPEEISYRLSDASFEGMSRSKYFESKSESLTPGNVLKNVFTPLSSSSTSLETTRYEKVADISRIDERMNNIFSKMGKTLDQSFLPKFNSTAVDENSFLFDKKPKEEPKFKVSVAIPSVEGSNILPKEVPVSIECGSLKDFEVDISVKLRYKGNSNQ